MPVIDKSPLRFHPYFKSVLWGGDGICAYKGTSSVGNAIGESWEISAIPGHVSIVAEGPYEGLDLNRLIGLYGSQLLGDKVMKAYNGSFPLLVKLLDTAADVSVQVHPDDELARKRHGCLGKTEMWYVIRSLPGATIYSGFKREISRDEFLDLASAGLLRDVLAEHESAPGDIFMLPAGRVHAIGAGNLLAEIQASSDITYRIDDYGRLDADGRKRELHIDLALDAIDFRVSSDYKTPDTSHVTDDCEIARCRHFVTRRLKVNGTKTLQSDSSSFAILLCISGSVDLIFEGGSMPLSQGHTVMLPAAMESVDITGKATLLLIHL